MKEITYKGYTVCLNEKNKFASLIYSYYIGKIKVGSNLTFVYKNEKDLYKKLDKKIEDTKKPQGINLTEKLIKFEQKYCI